MSVLESGKQQEKQQEHHLKPWQFKPGQSGNPSGRPKGSVSLKQYAKNMLLSMTDNERQEFMKGLPKDKIWEMAEGKPKQETELSGSLTISEVLDQLENGPTTSGQDVEDQSSVQDPEQGGQDGNVHLEPGASSLPPEQVASELDSEV